MEHGNRFIIIICIFAISMIFIHRARAPQQLTFKSVPIVCLTAKDAEQQKADSMLHKDYSLAHTTLEMDDPTTNSYRCYFKFPSQSVSCVPKAVATRNNITQAPSWPALYKPHHRSCYFIDNAYKPLHVLLSKKPPVSRKQYNGIIVKNVNEAKKMLKK